MDLPRLISLDHNYARRDAYGGFLRPTKTLFPIRANNQSSDRIDVEKITPAPPTEYDPVRADYLMEECERFVVFARVSDTEESSSDDWENISKDGWTQDQGWIFKKVTDILQADRLARLALKGCWGEAAKRRAHIDRAAQKFRNVMATVAWDMRLAQWLHRLLVVHLDVSSRAAYVDILQTLKARIPTLVDRLLAGVVCSKVHQRGFNLFLKRPWDPAVYTLNAKKMSKLEGDPIILLVPSSLKKEQMTPRCNRWLTYLSSLALLITVTAIPGTISPRMTIQAYLEQMVITTKSRLITLRKEYPDRPIVLIGWRSGAAIALQVATGDTVAAVITLGFSTRTVEGPRGDPDDWIYNLTCPVMFVTGELATTARPEDLEEIRSKLLCVSWLVVVGQSDDCLRMFRRHRITMGVTQSLVDHAVLEAVGEFLTDLLVNYDCSRPPTPIPPQAHRISRLSTDSSIDSEGSHHKQSHEITKRIKMADLCSQSLNGSSSQTALAPKKRGRKKGSLNKSSLNKISPKKTLQTLTPVTRPTPPDSEESSKSDLAINIGPVGSLAGAASISRTGPPQHVATAPGTATFRIHAGRISSGSSSAPVTEIVGTIPITTNAAAFRLQQSTPGATFRIQAGRVSTSSAPPADVMPIRPSENTAFSALGTPLKLAGSSPTVGIISKDNVYVENSPAIVTLGTVPAGTLPVVMQGSARLGALTTIPSASRLSSSPPKTTTSSSPTKKFNVNRLPLNSNRSRSMIRMSSVRQTNLPSTSKGPVQNYRMNTLAGNLGKPNSSVIRTASSVPVKRYVMAKRYSMGSLVHQKPLIVKSRTVNQDSADSTLTYLQTDGTDEHAVGSDVPVVMMNSTNTDVAGVSQVGEPIKQSPLVFKERPKQHLVLSAGEQYVSQSPSTSNERRVAGDDLTYILNYQNKVNEPIIYEIVETLSS